ncbi:histidine-rich glycoprotein [Elgaria multicarinata webbii]|uniref:histidine-rich glycoprotein n=1 Tax=Elgaria multicarinata webbii TaxID=159646 RepID=UPI002FCD115A
MELLSIAVFITVLFSSNAQSQPSVVSANCSDVEIEKDAELALDLINKHRRDGYIFTLLRIADAYIQHVSNASIVYLTLDVLETECPVLSRKHWSSCRHRDFYPNTDFGQCKAVVSVDRFFKREKLYGYNCTVSPVPPQLFECKRCPVKVTLLEDTEEYSDKAKKILERYLQESNGTRYFKVDKVQKVFSAVADRTAYVVEFTIKEATCPTTTHPRNASECEFLPDRYAHMGFCKGKVVKDTKDPDGVEVQSCEIYDVHGKFDRFPFHHRHHFHHGSGERHHHCSMSENECRFPPPHPHHHHPHRHHPHRHHPHHHHPHHHDHGHGSSYPPPPDHEHHGLSGFVDHHNSSHQDKKEHPDFPPPAGPRDPPPPAGCPHHLPPSKYPPPPVGPPPPPPPHRPHRQSSRLVHKHGRHGHHHDHRCNNASNERGVGDSSEEQDSFRDHHSPHHSKIDSIYHIPVLSQHDVLQAPGANFLSRPDSSHGRHKEPTLPGRHVHKKPVVQPFPEVPSGSKSCPGKPKHESPPGLLSLYPS